MLLLYMFTSVRSNQLINAKHVVDLFAVMSEQYCFLCYVDYAVALGPEATRGPLS